MYYVCMYICAYVLCVCVCLYVCIYYASILHVRIYVSVCIHGYVCVCILHTYIVYVCVYVCCCMYPQARLSVIISDRMPSKDTRQFSKALHRRRQEQSDSVNILLRHLPEGAEETHEHPSFTIGDIPAEIRTPHFCTKDHRPLTATQSVTPQTAWYSQCRKFSLTRRPSVCLLRLWKWPCCCSASRRRSLRRPF